MKDEMFFSGDSMSLRRGKRAAARTETCRPCVVWHKDDPDDQRNGVILNVTPYGMLVRMLQRMPLGTELMVQMMRDDGFSVPLARPVAARVVRHEESEGDFVDHGIQLVREEVQRSVSRPANVPVRQPMRFVRPRMHTIDVTIGEALRGRRSGRRRG